MYTSLLSSHGLSMATDVVISGCSAGGLATFLHTDQARASHILSRPFSPSTAVFHAASTGACRR